MPQLPTNTAEEYGADDEVKEYRQEDDEGSENSTVDVVNDIKSDLIKKDAEDQTLDSVSYECFPSSTTQSHNATCICITITRQITGIELVVY